MNSMIFKSRRLLPRCILGTYHRPGLCLEEGEVVYCSLPPGARQHAEAILEGTGYKSLVGPDGLPRTAARTADLDWS